MEKNGDASAVTGPPEAKHLFVLMKRHYRISRNVRAQWYFHNLNQTIELEDENDVDKDDCDLAVIGAYPEGSSSYKLTPSTMVTFLSRNYRLVFVLDFSPSTAIADSDLNCVLQDNIFTSFRNFLIGLVQQFRIPSRKSVFSPQLFITVIAYTPFLRNRSRQVLLQGCGVNFSNIWTVLREIEFSLERFLRGVAEASAFALEMSETNRKFRSFVHMEKTSTTNVPPPANQPLTYNIPLQVPSDSILIDMVRFGMLAVQLLPENTSAGMIFFTDGVLGVPDVSILETLLVQLRIWTIGCTFVLVQSKAYNPDCSFGKVSNTEFMRFLASATFGAYLESCPNVGPSPEKNINLYHKAILCWSFQRALDLTRQDSGMKPENSRLQFRSMRHKHYCCVLATSLTSILSVRLREGYTIRSCAIANSQIRVDLVLPWKYQVNMEYVIISDWPTPKQNARVQIEFWTETSFEFLNDILSPKQTYRSPYRAAVVSTFFNSVQNLTQADKILMTFESFRTNSIYYTIPDSLKTGMPLFCVVSDSDQPVISSKDLQQKHGHFCNFWRPVCSLDINVWQKWLHTHRITLLLTHDVPLSSHLHSPSSTSGRYGSITCRQAAAAIDNALQAWSTFTLMESHSYIKFENELSNSSSVPEFFYIIRPTFKPPCVVVRLAFLGGIKGSVRHRVVLDLTEKLLLVTIKQRASLDQKFLHVTSSSSNVGISNEAVGRKSVQSLRTEMVEIKACRHTKKPVEKILVRYNRIPKILSFMVQEEDVNKSTALNNVLCRYLHCKRWIWSLKRSTSSFPISCDAAANILNTLLRKRLNETFLFAFGNDGVITLLKEYSVVTENNLNSSCIVQYVMYPPIASPFVTAATTPRNVPSIKATRESICSENEQSEAESAETNRDIQLVTELWVEPQYGKLVHEKEVLICEDLFHKFYAADSTIVKSLATFEHLKSLKDDVERRYYAKQSSSMFSKIDSEAQRTSFSRTDVEIDFNPDIDQSVAFITSCFDVCLLFENCRMASLWFSTLTCVKEPLKNEDLPNYLFVEALHHELKRWHDSSWLIHREREVHRFWQLIINRMLSRVGVETNSKPPRWLTNLQRRSSKTFENQIHRLPLVVCYIRKISDNRLAVVICPKSLEDIHLMWTVADDDTDRSGEKVNFETESNGSVSFPLLIFNCHENFIWNVTCGDETRDESTNFDFVQDYRCNNSAGGDSVLGSFHRQISYAETDEIESVVGRRKLGSVLAPQPTEADNFNFHWYCSNMESLYSRAFVTAVYRALISDCYVCANDIKISIEGKCEEMAMDVDLTEFMEVVCDHFKEYLTEETIGRRRDTMDTTSSSFSLMSNSGADVPPCFVTSACFKETHNFIRDTFSIILNRHFKPVKDCDEFYYYCPPLRLEEPVSEADSFGTASHDDFQQNDETVTFDNYDESETEKETSQQTVEESTATVVALNQDRNKLSLTTSTLTRETLRSLPDVSSTSSTDGSNELMTSAWRYPMFLHLACSIKIGNDLFTCTVQDFPTCLAELFRKCEFDNWNEDLRTLQITCDILILTVGHDDNFASLDVIATSPLSKSDENLAGSTKFSTDDDSLTMQARPLLDIPETQRIMLDNLKAEILLLIENEILFAYRNNRSINLSILNRVVSHINRITNKIYEQDFPKPNATVEQIPLTFVLNENESAREFTKQLTNLSSTYFKINDVGQQTFYAVVDRNRYREMTTTSERPFAELPTSESVFMKPDDSTAPVLRLQRDLLKSSRSAKNERFFVKRSQSFAGFSRLFYAEREQILKGRWTSVSDVMTFDGRLLKRLELRSGGETVYERYWSGTSTITSTRGQWTKQNDGTVNKDQLTETGYDAESSEAAGQDELDRLPEDGKFNQIENYYVPDFWLVISVVDSVLKVLFLERIPDSHKAEFDRLVNDIKNLSKKVNQKMLLKNLFETSLCNNLLVAENGSKLGGGNASHFADEDEFYENDQVGYLAASAKYAPGSFACPCVYFRWFPIHVRLKTGAGRVGTNRAMQALKSLLNKFLVHNRENMFVFKETLTDAVFYIKLHDKASTASSALVFPDDSTTNGKLKVKFAESHKTEISAEEFSSSVQHKISSTKHFAKELAGKLLITVHGICEPGDEIKIQLMNALEHKLNDAVLEQLLVTLERNPNCKLSSEDVDFLQAKNKPADELWCYALPSIAITHLYAISYYLRQHLLDFLRCPNYATNTEQFRVYGSTPAAGDDAYVYLYYPPVPSSARGIAVISNTFVDTYGNSIPLVHFDVLDAADGFRSFFQSGQTFETLTNVVECRASELKTKKSTAASSAFVQFAVWKTGDVSTKQLCFSLKQAVVASLCDLATEFGLFTASLLETNGLASDPASEPGSPTEKNYSDTQTVLRKRHSSAAMNASKMSIFNFENFQKSSADTAVKRSTETLSSDDSFRRRQINNNTSHTVLKKVSNGDARSSTRLNPIFATIAPVWFDYVANLNCSSLVRFTLQLDADFGRQAAVKEIFESLKRYLVNDSDVFSFAETNLQLGGRIFDMVVPSKFSATSDDSQENEFQCVDSKNNLIACQSIALWRDTMQFGRATSQDSPPPSVANFMNPAVRVLQRLTPFCPKGGRGFIPRQRIILVSIHERTVSFYAYNFVTEIVQTLKGITMKLICWHNARAHLLKRICLQKLGFFYPVYIPETSLKSNPYLASQWVDSDHFVVNSAPPNQFPSVPKSTILCQQPSALQSPYKSQGSPSVWSEMKRIAGDVACFDPVSAHGLQMVHAKNLAKKRCEDDFHFEKIYRDWSATKSENRVPAIDDALLKQMVNRSRLIHFVYTPFLFHPNWREKVGQIRQPGIHTDHHRPPSPQFQRSRHSSGQSQGQKQSTTSSGPVSPLMQPKAHNLFGTGVELWHLQLQNLMAQQYTLYLQNVGLTLLQKKQKRNSTTDQLFDPLAANDVCEIWFQKIIDCGVLLVRAFFEEPYFAVQFYLLHASEFDSSNRFAYERKSNELARYCLRFASLSHLHSFSYDFHLRMVSSYAAGDRQITFKPGYNMHAFLNDFLRYYTCRPPYARTHVFEDHLAVSGLPIRNEQLYNYLLDHDKTYGLRVVRMRVPSAGNNEELTSEYLLTSHDNFVLKTPDRTDINYQVLHILMRDDWDDFEQQPPAPLSRKLASLRDWLSLKFYVIFVDHENTFPLLSSPDNVDRGKYERVRTPSWVIGERLSGDGAVQSRCVMQHAPFRTQSQAETAAPAAVASSYRHTYSPTKKSTVGVDPIVGNVRGRTLSGDSGARRALSGVRFEVTRVSEGDLDTRDEFGWKSTMDLLATASTSSDDIKTESAVSNPIPTNANFSPVPRQPEGSSLQAEVVTYLTYVTDFESANQQILTNKTAEFKTRLRSVVREAASHCRRDQLWRRLLTGVCNDATVMKRREESGGITFFEFQTLLQLAHSITIEEMDPNLSVCSKLSVAATKSLIRSLSIKYGDHCRKFVSGDGAWDYLVVLNSNYLDTFIMVSSDTRKEGSTVIKMVYKDYAAVESDSESRFESRMYRHLTIKNFWQDFVNALAYNLWCRLSV